MTTRITDNTDAIVVRFHCGEIVKPDSIQAIDTSIRAGYQRAVDQAKPLHFDLSEVGTLSAAAIGRFVHTGREALDANVNVLFVIPNELEGMFRILRLDNLFQVRVHSVERVIPKQ